MSDDDFVVTQRDINSQRVRGGWMIDVIGLDFENRSPTWVPKKNLGTYALKIVTEDMADVIRGDIPETEGPAVIHIGDNFGKHYYTSHDSETIPVDVLEWMEQKGLTLIRGVDGGWKSWDGRPEFSTNYADFSECEVIDPSVEIEKRRSSGE